MLIFVSFLVNLGMLNPKMVDTKNNFNALTLKYAKSKMIDDGMHVARL